MTEHHRPAAAGAEKGLHHLIREKAVKMAFQPIVDLRNGEVTGYEALARPDDACGFANPDELFEAAVAHGRVEELERLTRRMALDALSTWDHAFLLFLNNTPAMFMAEGFEATLCDEISRTPNVDPSRIVLEITEKATDDFEGDVGLQALILREQGFRTAIDDVGAGISGLNQITCLRPNWIKLDRQLIADIDSDMLKQNLIRFFVHFARLSDMSLVAEGIERKEELTILMRLGVTHAQGYYLGRPAPEATPLAEPVIASLSQIRDELENTPLFEKSTLRIESLAAPVATCDMEDDVATALEHVRHHTNPSGIIVLHGRRVLGWLDRSALEFAETEGQHTDPVRCLALRDLARVGADVTIPTAMEVIAAQPECRQSLPLIVLDRGNVTGLLSLRQLLLAAAECHDRPSIRLATIAGLPDRFHADNWIRLRCERKVPGHLAFFDVRDFDAYTSAYGPEMADTMLVRLVALIRDEFEESKIEGIIAYLGEDRLLAHVPVGMESKLVSIIDDFTSSQREFFSAADYSTHQFTYTAATGEERTSPLTSVRVVLVNDAYQRWQSPQEVHRLAVELRLRTAPAGVGVANQIITDQRDRRSVRRKSA